MSTATRPSLHLRRIRDRRLELGLSERDVAAHWGLSTAVVRNVEAGRTDADLTLGQLVRLAEVLPLTSPTSSTPANRQTPCHRPTTARRPDASATPR